MVHITGSNLLPHNTWVFLNPIHIPAPKYRNISHGRWHHINLISSHDNVMFDAFF